MHVQTLGPRVAVIVQAHTSWRQTQAAGGLLLGPPWTWADSHELVPFLQTSDHVLFLTETFSFQSIQGLFWFSHFSLKPVVCILDAVHQTIISLFLFTINRHMCSCLNSTHSVPTWAPADWPGEGCLTQLRTVRLGEHLSPFFPGDAESFHVGMT